MKNSFFRRRKILKSANTLDLHPVKNYKDEVDDDGIVRVLIPKVKNDFLKNILTKLNKNVYMKVKFDKYGSEVWKRIDGNRDVNMIVNDITNVFLSELSEADNRTINFIFILYQQGFISFKELIKQE
ncbi:PqqD family protein [Ignavibacterium sp.]|uniref:PqqD family protein n=1 Tax=Ignavibacterium sp. TaxID=2651167 RepID=UPI00307CF347